MDVPETDGHEKNPKTVKDELPVEEGAEGEDRTRENRKVKVLFLGLNGAGKTTILHNLRYQEIVPPNSFQPIGFNSETVVHKDTSFIIWDIEVGGKLPPSWSYHMTDAGQAIMFAVDSADRERMREASAELQKILNNEDLKDAVLLVFANKQDLPTAQPVHQVVEKLGLHEVRRRQWYVVGTNALTTPPDSNLIGGLDWIHQTFKTDTEDVSGDSDEENTSNDNEGEDKNEKRKRKILLLGLDGAGKTTVLYKYKIGEAVITIPTIGFNIESTSYSQTNYEMWDLGGSLSTLWRTYKQEAQAVIFIVDATDHERITVAANELKRIFDWDDMEDALLLVMVNKADLPGAMTVDDATEKLELHNLQDRQWHALATNALTGDNLYEGLHWIDKTLK